MAMTFNMLGGLFLLSNHGASGSAIGIASGPGTDKS
jgi:hypothetical protein